MPYSPLKRNIAIASAQIGDYLLEKSILLGVRDHRVLFLSLAF